MSIDERLSQKEFPLPAIRQVNLSMHPSGISLGLGELKEFSVHPLIKKELTDSLDKNGTAYAHNAGLPELRQAVALSQSNKDGFNYNMNHVVITVGVQNALYTTFKTLSDLGARRVLIPEIYFGIYKKIPATFNFEIVAYPLTTNFGIDISKLESIIKDDDVLVVNSPANPTGRVLLNTELEQLGNLLTQKLTRGYAIADEIYDQLIYEGERPAPLASFFNRTITVNGISKSGAAAGFRVGWAITNNEKLARAFTANNATVISSPPTANQYAAIPVVNGSTHSYIHNYNSTLLNNRNYVIDQLQHHNIKAVMPTGSFYVFPDISGKVGPDTTQFCLDAAKKKNGVVVIPGVAFGAPSHVRISLATEQIKEGIARFLSALATYR